MGMDVGVGLVGASAIRTDAFDDEADRGGLVTLGQMDIGQGHLFKAEGAMTLLTMEMCVLVVVCRVVVALAEFITDAVTGIFQNVHKMGVTE